MQTRIWEKELHPVLILTNWKADMESVSYGGPSVGQIIQFWASDEVGHDHLVLMISHSTALCQNSYRTVKFCQWEFTELPKHSWTGPLGIGWKGHRESYLVHRSFSKLKISVQSELAVVLCSTGSLNIVEVRGGRWKSALSRNGWVAC